MESNFVCTDLSWQFEGETTGGAQNPILSSVLYLSEGRVGGPTLVTNQRLKDTAMASKGYLTHPKVCFHRPSRVLYNW